MRAGLLRLADGQRTDADSGVLEDNDGAARHCPLDGGQVGEQQRDLVDRAPARAAAKEDYRRSLLASESQ